MHEQIEFVPSLSCLKEAIRLLLEHYGVWQSFGKSYIALGCDMLSGKRHPGGPFGVRNPGPELDLTPRAACEWGLKITQAGRGGGVSLG